MLRSSFASKFVGPAVRSRQFHATALNAIKAGDSVPSATLYDGAPSAEFDLAKETKNGKFLLLGVPGAFSPGCTATYIPRYLELSEQWKSKGVQKIFVVAVNDSFVTKAWAKSLQESDPANTSEEWFKVLSDASGKFSTELDVLFDGSKFFGNHRSARYAAVIENGKFSNVQVEPDHTGIDVSAADKFLEEI